MTEDSVSRTWQKQTQALSQSMEDSEPYLITLRYQNFADATWDLADWIKKGNITEWTKSLYFDRQSSLYKAQMAYDC